MRNILSFLILSIMMILAVNVLGCIGSQGTSDSAPNGVTKTNAVDTQKTQTNNPVSSSVGFSRANPAPVGTPVTYTHGLSVFENGKIVKKGDYTVKVVIEEIRRGENNVTELLNNFGKAEYSIGSEPIAYKIRWEVVKAPNTDTPISISFVVESNSAITVIDRSSNIGNSNFPEYWPKSVYEGGVIEGWDMCSIGSDDNKPMLKFDVISYSGDSPIWLALY